jgi:hypothetical protein
MTSHKTVMAFKTQSIGKVQLPSSTFAEELYSTEVGSVHPTTTSPESQLFDLDYQLRLPSQGYLRRLNKAKEVMFFFHLRDFIIFLSCQNPKLQY